MFSFHDANHVDRYEPRSDAAGAGEQGSLNLLVINKVSLRPGHDVVYIGWDGG
jgi:hypothetical protein